MKDRVVERIIKVSDKFRYRIMYLGTVIRSNNSSTPGCICMLDEKTRLGNTWSPIKWVHWPSGVFLKLRIAEV